MSKANNNKKKGSTPIPGTCKESKSRSQGDFCHFGSNQARPRSRPLFEQFKKKHMQLLPFKTPELYTAGGDPSKEWYINYWYLNPATGKYQRFKPTFDINRIKDLQLKTKYGKEAAKFLLERLEAGYNPFDEQKLMADYKPNQTGNNENQENRSGETCLRTLNNKVVQLISNATPEAKHTYNVVYNRFEKFVEAKNYKAKVIEEIDISICYEFQQWGMEDKKWSKKTINATISHLGLFWDALIKSKRIPVNYWRQVTTLKKKDFRGKVKSKTKDNDFIPCTGTEMDKIIEEFNKRNARNFLRFLGMIFYGWARPVEITRLRIGDIDMNLRSIRFLKDITKDDEFAHVQIVDPLFNMLNEIDFKKYPSKYFLFSKDNFLPGDSQLDAWHDCTDKMWNRVVHDVLGIDKKMYSLKHTGNIEYLLKNKGRIDIKWQQMQNRHSSPSVTENYNKRLGVYFVDTQSFKFRDFI